MTKQLFFWILITKLCVLAAILVSGIGLMPDEAQYWTWSQALSYGYYSKPAGIAWQIAFGTLFFGNTILGVKFMALVLSFCLSYAIFFLVKASGASEKSAALSAIAFSFSPLGFFSGFFATTDCGFILFWTLACALFLRANCQTSIALSFVIALGAQWKWPIYSLWLVIFFFRPTKKTIGHFLVSLVGLIPSLLWNVEHDFATFKHVTASINVIHAPKVEAKPNPIDFIGAQFALASPILFILLILSVLQSMKRYKSQPESVRFCVSTTCACFLAILGMSIFKKAQGNWAAFAYPTAFALFGHFLDHYDKKRGYTYAAISLSATLLVAAVSLSQLPIPLRYNPFKEGLGWNRLSDVLIARGYDPQEAFLFSGRYQMTSIASFYGPEQKRAYFLNIHHLRKNQFSYWPGIQECCLGKKGYFIEAVIDKDPTAETMRFKELLSAYFDSVIDIAPTPLYQTKSAIILLCEGYKGDVSVQQNKY